MSNQVFGAVNWTDDAFGSEKRVNSKDLFLRLDEGQNIVRLVTQPFQYLVHKVKKDPNNSKDFGQKVKCSAIHGKCAICETNDKAKPRWLLGVISRKGNVSSYKILDISFAVFSQIRKYAKNLQYFGDPTKYDLNIEVDKNGGATGYYSVQALTKEPLSATDQVIKDSVDLEDLKRRATPFTVEQVQTQLERIYGPEGLPSKTTVASVNMSTEDDELEKSFPNYEETVTA
jgi:hypothetical protein